MRKLELRLTSLFSTWCIALLMTQGIVWGQEKPERPNIVFIVADDLGWGDVGWNQSEIPTPNLSRLAASGAILDNHYVQPVCSPTRAAFLTGRYPMRHGLQVGVVRPWAQYGLPLKEQTIAQGLQSAGYKTAIVGKWHLGHVEKAYLPTQRGFDHQYGHYNGALDYNSHERDGGFDWHRDDQVNRDEGYSTHLIAKESVRIVEKYAGKEPYFLYVPFNAVHSPFQVPSKYTDAFPQLKGNRKAYAGMLAAMDEAIGQIADAIEKSGTKENTLLVFTSDNGGPAPGKVTSNGPLRAGKGTVYEGGVRVAAFATWPGVIPAGKKVTLPIHIADWYPTLHALSKVQVDQKLPLDGKNVWDAIVTKDDASIAPELTDRSILINATANNGAIRVKDWKLVVNGGPAFADADAAESEDANTEKSGKEKNDKEQLELFDLASDPYEKTNLASQQPDKRDELLEKFRAYQKQVVAPKLKPRPADFKSPAVWGDFPVASLGEVGSVVTAFEAMDDEGKLWKSEDHIGKKNLVVYFYPADMTGGCTKQACSYRDNLSHFQSYDVDVIGISGDSVANHQAFKKAHSLNFRLLADVDGKVATALRVPVTRESKVVLATVGDQNLQLTRDVTSKRWTFIIDKEGKIIYKNENVVAANDSQVVLDVLKQSLGK